MTGRPRTARGREFRLEFATGGRPVEACLRAMAALPVLRGQVWMVDICHDDGCPATPDGPMFVCTCEIVELVARRAA